MAEIKANIVHEAPSQAFDPRRMREASVIATRQAERFQKDLVNLVINLKERVEKLETERCQCKV